ncbi:hypothetical protein T492DRAFT_903332 [Pavlovales sp. CCMP2436]|nr:hypothetical protein T492DRAFT_903332 [Pavlovales sp. CCMP2436]
MAEALVGGKAETSSLCGAVVAGGLAVVHRLIIGVPIRHIDLRPGVPMICREVEREIIQSVDLALIGCEAEVARGLEAALSWALPGWSTIAVGKGEAATARQRACDVVHSLDLVDHEAGLPRTGDAHDALRTPTVLA